ncbi:MAG TPA: hypothetical protein VHJ77_09485 [Vicinamibacterales bacterium]|nr:hypothetical protein [Vicinamibacterales bacterium]
MAEIPLLSDGVEFLLRRTRAFVRSTPAATRAAANGYLRTQGNGRRASARTEPYWLFLPRWLAGKFDAPRPRVVDDFVWGQYCLFAYVRMRDDVLDRQTANPRLVFAADGFLVEAERAFARHVRDEAFWAFFRQALERTAHGILEADALQRRTNGSVRPLCAAYARVSAIFKVGSAAICLPANRRAAFARVERFADHLAVAGQLLDDLEDVHEDLSDGRCNAAAKLLTPGVGPADPTVGERITHALVAGTRLKTLLDIVERRIRMARAAIAPLRMRDADAYLVQVGRELADIRLKVHRARVATVFGQAHA